MKVYYPHWTDVSAGAAAFCGLERRVAVVGGGIAGLAAAMWLRDMPGVRTTLFEAQPRLGGHAHAVDVTLPGPDGRLVTHPVDTGFLVCNERTYPGLLGLFASLGVELARSDMSFSVQSPRRLSGRAGRFEWSGSDLRSVFAQPRNALSPRFLGMLAEILRFNRLTTALANGRAEGPTDNPANDAHWREPLGEFLRRHRFGSAFQEGYLLPMIACIWSCPPDQMLRFPIATLVRFCHNHGLLQVEDRPGWFTVRGGSGRYVERIVRSLADVRAATPVRHVERGRLLRLTTDQGHEAFDAVILACHAPQALRLLGASATDDERRVLGALRTQPNTAVLHTDATLLPHAKRAWAAWNFERGDGDGSGAAPVCLHYWINRLQPLPFRDPVIVSLNPLREPDPRTVLGRWEMDHPVFDLQAIDAQRELPKLQGQGGVYFAGAWSGYGFHEDGYQSGVAAAEATLRRLTALPVGVPA